MFSDLLIYKYPEWMQQAYKEQFITIGYKQGVNYLKYCEILNIMEHIYQARAVQDQNTTTQLPAYIKCPSAILVWH